MLTFFTRSLLKVVFILMVQIVGGGRVNSNCTTRRCLAQYLINKDLTTQPQDENCTQLIYLPSIEYETLSVSTKKLRLHSRLQATMVWTDPALAWDTSVYQYETVVLPVNKIWIPDIHVTNAFQTTVTHDSKHLVAYSNGTVVHSVQLKSEVDCEVNLFNYPFAADECPVVLDTWAREGCGMKIRWGEVYMLDGNHGDWKTEAITLYQLSDYRNYILVSLSVKHISPFITLMFPSILIILADMVSFALPLGGGERNCFKVTLALSFTMFLVILNDLLPGDAKCSPIIRIHFCICLSLLVLSMLVSMVLTRLAHDGRLMLCCGLFRKIRRAKEMNEQEGVKPDVSVIGLKEPENDSQKLKKIVNFLEALNAKERESNKAYEFANTLDKIYFWLYFVLGTIYFIIMMCMMTVHRCKIDHFSFWPN